MHSFGCKANTTTDRPTDRPKKRREKRSTLHTESWNIHQTMSWPRSNYYCSLYGNDVSWGGTSFNLSGVTERTVFGIVCGICGMVKTLPFHIPFSVFLQLFFSFFLHIFCSADFFLMYGCCSFLHNGNVYSSLSPSQFRIPLFDHNFFSSVAAFLITIFSALRCIVPHERHKRGRERERR